MSFPWTHHVEADVEGGYVLSVLGLRDFELHAETAEELERDWREALASHLMGYLAVGKAVPFPGAIRFLEPTDTEGEGTATCTVLNVTNNEFEVAPC